MKKKLQVDRFEEGLAVLFDMEKNIYNVQKNIFGFELCAFKCQEERDFAVYLFSKEHTTSFNLGIHFQPPTLPELGLTK